MQRFHGGGLYFIRESGAADGEPRVQLFDASGPRNRAFATLEFYQADDGSAVQITLNDVTISYLRGLEERLTIGGLTLAGNDGLAQLDLRFYDRIGPVAEGPELSDADVETLADTMAGNLVQSGPQRARIPAAYTYFGQFLAHDMTRMEIEPHAEAPATVINRRSSQVLDFSTLFGLTDGAPVSPEWEQDGEAWLGPVSGSANVEHRDLPRLPNGAPSIKDSRNDVTLAMAQMHVLLARFHKAVCSNHPLESVAEAQDRTRSKLQSLVLLDYLPRIVTPNVYNDILEHGRSIVAPDARGPQPNFLVPIEFAAACFRFGHSMVRPRYNGWNNSLAAEISTLLRYTHNHRPDLTSGLSDALSSQRRLKSGWTQDWRRLVDGPSGTEAHVLAAPIDTKLGIKMGALPNRLLPENEILGPGQFSLAQTTLRRGRALQLATAGQMFQALQTACAGTTSESTVTVLADAVIDAGTGLSMGANAPLWYYTLREAEHFNGQLGAIAGRIVMETLHAAIEFAPTSIIRRDEEDKPQITEAPFTLRDVVAAAFPN